MQNPPHEKLWFGQFHAWLKCAETHTCLKCQLVLTQNWMGNVKHMLNKRGFWGFVEFQLDAVYCAVKTEAFL